MRVLGWFVTRKVWRKNLNSLKIYFFFGQFVFKTSAGLELRGGSGSHEGNIFLDGRPVCDDGFSGGESGHQNAIVVCRSPWQSFNKIFRSGCLVSRVAPSGGTLISEEFQTTSSWTMFFVLGRKKISGLRYHDAQRGYPLNFSSYSISGIVHIIALTTAKVMRERGWFVQVFSTTKFEAIKFTLVSRSVTWSFELA